MKKINININHKNWKIKKRHSFSAYFILLTMVVVFVTTIISASFSEWIRPLFKDKADIPSFITTILISLIIGLILSFFIGKWLLAPIKKLKVMMSEVAEGDLSIKTEEKSIFDEVEDIYHYFNLMMDELRATETIQSDFVSNVSHEFKTPLNAIDGYATLLSSDDVTEEEKKEYIQKILYNTRRMDELIGNILLLSKVDNQAINSKKCHYSLDEQIRQSILQLEPKWSKKDIDFDVELDSIEYFGNEGIMIHVWNNLIDNAIKFGPKNSTIKISLKEDVNKVIFVIEDSGPGIPEDAQKYIYYKFYQSDVSHKSEGNGLGLALVKKILDLSYGVIEVENIEPVGCRFKVYLFNPELFTNSFL